MSIKNKVNDIRKAVEQLAVSEKMREKYSLPSNCCFLNEDEIVCGERKFGDSRYPYSQDGLTLWAHSSGNVKIEESTFNVILNSIEGKEPNLAFYLGEKKGNTYFPLSITGAGKLPFEENIKRYTVYTPDAVYYMADTTSATTCVRMFVDQEKMSVLLLI